MTETKADGPDTKWNELKKIAEEAFAGAEFSLAESKWRELLSMDAHSEDDPKVLYALECVAQCCLKQGKDKEAEKVLRQVLEKRQRLIGNTHFSLTDCLMKVADLSYDAGRFKAAETEYRRALEIYENVLGKTHPAIGFTASKLARTYMAQEKFSQADTCYQTALFVTSEALGKDHPAVVEVLDEYLNLLYLTQNDDTAQQLEADMRHVPVPSAVDA